MRRAEEVSRAGLLAAEALGGAPAPERLAALRREPLLLSISPELAQHRHGQLMLATAASLLGRLFDFVGVIDLDARRASALPGIFGLRSRSRLADATAALLRSLRPRGSGADLDVAAAPRHERYARALAIGPVDVPLAREVVHVDGLGWDAWAGPTPPPTLGLVQGWRRGGGPPLNPFGPMVAATWGATEVAKSLFRSLAKDEAAVFPALEQTRHWDLWGHEFDRAPVGPRAGPGVDLGEVAVAGLGALGSAAVLALSHVSGLRGRIELVDDDRVSRSNLERVLTAGGRDVGRRKIDLARRALGCTGAQTACIASRYGAALPRGARAATIVLGVDSGAARRAITRHLPYAVYHGGTQGSEMLVSRHVAFAGACPECFYPEPPAAQRAEAPAARPDACARAVVVEALPEATIGFVSALCGFLMAAELVKDRLDPGRAAPLDDDRPVFRLDGLARTPGPECVEAYVPRRDCFCQSPEVRREIAARLGG